MNLIKTKVSEWKVIVSEYKIRLQLKMNLVIVLYENRYPLECNDEVFNKIMERAENFK